MKFGKYKNQPISALPTEYIEWFCGSVSGCDDIKREMQKVLLARWGGLKPKAKERPPEPEQARKTQTVMFDDPVPSNLVPWDGVSAPF